MDNDGPSTAFVCAGSRTGLSTDGWGVSSLRRIQLCEVPQREGFGLCCDHDHLKGRRSGRLRKQQGAVMQSNLESDRAENRENARKKPHIVVVGAGWGGFGASQVLVEHYNARVTLLDGSEDPAGMNPTLTKSGRPFDHGVRGFWFDYPNINELVASLGLKEADVFTDFLPSAFYGPNGLEATAPVFSRNGVPQLPSPLGQIAATVTNFRRLPIKDRTSMFGLLYAMADFVRDEETMRKYDRMSAHELFIRFGLSKRLVDDFLAPTLLVGLFKPPHELSAAVAMELLYFYALAHQTSFDVRWINNPRSIAANLFRPLHDRLCAAPGSRFVLQPSTFVTGLDFDDGRVTSVRCVTRSSSSSTPAERTIDDVDAVVLAVGANGMRKIMQGSAALCSAAPLLSQSASLGGIDVVAVRLWLDRKLSDHIAPANVLSKLDALRGAGGTFFVLDDIQSNFKSELWAVENELNGEDATNSDTSGHAEGTSLGSVLHCDLYNASGWLSMSDEDIVAEWMTELLPTALPEISLANVVDSHVSKYPGAVSLFSPGSWNKRPTTRVPGVKNVVCAGDWVRMEEREHGAKGLCQERAYVSGMEAANVLKEKGIVEGKDGKEFKVVPVREDEPQVKAVRAVNKKVMSVLGTIGLDSPWVR